MSDLRRFISTLLLFIAFLSTAAASSDDAIFSGWTHLELGAGNYGADGHTKTAVNMTLQMKIEQISDKKNFIDDLEEMGRGDYRPEEQYGILFWTLDELIDRYGNEGVFHVNDLFPEYALFAAQKLAEYAMSRGYTSVIIETIPGDYQLIDSTQTLFKYGKTRYTSVHLKNPEISFYHNQMDGDEFLTSDKTRAQTRSLLQSLAHLSENGLYLFIPYFKCFVPLEEQTEFVEKGIFYHQTTMWESVPYIFPEGNILDLESRVFHIKSESIDTGQLR